MAPLFTTIHLYISPCYSTDTPSTTIDGWDVLVGWLFGRLTMLWLHWAWAICLPFHTLSLSHLVHTQSECYFSWQIAKQRCRLLICYNALTWRASVMHFKVFRGGGTRISKYWAGCVNQTNASTRTSVNKEIRKKTNTIRMYG